MYNHQLDTFLIAAKCGSFSAAAKEMGISPSAVNQQITSLEKRLSLTLFHRSKSGLEPTIVAEKLISELPTMLHAVDRIQKIIEKERAESITETEN